MVTVEPNEIGGCPEGYEYVKGYTDKKGGYVHPFCRKCKKTTVVMKLKIDYPGNTKISASVRKGLKYHHVTETVPTEEIMNSKDQKKIGNDLVKLLDGEQNGMS